jgi:hypothetical protein
MMHDPDRLQEMLEHESYIDDGGFTERVMAKLPARRREPRAWVMAISLCASGGVGVAVLPRAVKTALVSLATMPAPAWATPGLLVAGLATVGAAAIVGLAVMAAEV